MVFNGIISRKSDSLISFLIVIIESAKVLSIYYYQKYMTILELLLLTDTDFKSLNFILLINKSSLLFNLHIEFDMYDNSSIFT